MLIRLKVTPQICVMGRLRGFWKVRCAGMTLSGVLLSEAKDLPRPEFISAPKQILRFAQEDNGRTAFARRATPAKVGISEDETTAPRAIIRPPRVIPAKAGISRNYQRPDPLALLLRAPLRPPRSVNSQRCGGFDVRHETFIAKFNRVIDLA